MQVCILKKFDYKDCEIWFVRFSVDVYHGILALGNQVKKPLNFFGTTMKSRITFSRKYFFRKFRAKANAFTPNAFLPGLAIDDAHVAQVELLVLHL